MNPYRQQEEPSEESMEEAPYGMAPQQDRFPIPSQNVIQTPLPNPAYPGLQPPPYDQGGLKGQIPPQTPTGGKMRGEGTSRERMLRSQIKYLVLQNPKVKLHQTSQLDEELSRYNTEELMILLDNVKSQCGGLGPYSTSLNTIRIGGLFIERKLKKPGYAQALASDVELITACNELLPWRLSEFGAPLQIVWSLMSNYFLLPDQKIEDGKASPPRETPHHRPVPDGENDVRGEVDPEPVSIDG